MKSWIENINSGLEEIRTLIESLISQHSSTTPANHNGSRLEVISPNGDQFFNDLSPEGLKLQDKLFKKCTVIFELISALLADSTPKNIKKFESNKQKILKIAKHEGLVWDFEISGLNATIDEVKIQLNDLFGATQSQTIIVPDTNALYKNLNLEDWNFPEFNSFQIVLTPSILDDLDKHKIEHRNESIKKKALTLINKIKEYRRRGDILDGITVVKNMIGLKSIATEPDFTKTLKWLQSENKDDRLIAEFLEIAKQHANDIVILITGDINLQTKCEFARIPYLEAPANPHEV